MSLTNIANRLTPSTPIEITFGAQPVVTGKKFATLFGHRASSGGSGVTYAAYDVVNVGDSAAAKAEVEALAGSGAEIAKMAEAFIKANSTVEGRSNFPAFRVVLLAYTDTDFGASDEALEAVKLKRNDLLVSCYPASDSANVTKLKNLAILMSGADRDLNGQFGSFVVAAETEASASALLLNVDSKFVLIPYLQDTSLVPSQSAAIIASGVAAVMLQNQFPYLPLDAAEVGGLIGPAKNSDVIVVDPNGLSEAALAAGLAPLTVSPTGAVKMIRAKTSWLTQNSIPVTAYQDYEEIVTLYDFREDVFLRLQQPDLKPKKASIQTAKLIKDEIIRLAKAYEAAEAFQRVNELAPLFEVARSESSRSRFDFKIPVNVVPPLHVVAGNIQATTLFDSFTL